MELIWNATMDEITNMIMHAYMDVTIALMDVKNIFLI